jgi:cardiolipin synthase
MNVMTLIMIIYQVAAISAVIHVVMDNRQPAKTMVWALIILFVPIIGIVAYLFFGVNTRRERLVSRRSLDQLSRRSMFKFTEQGDLVLPEEHKPLIDLFTRQNFALPFGDNNVSLFTDGYPFFLQLLRDIGNALHHIHIDIYIFEDDALGRLVADALIDRARKGVEVRIIYDDVGCWTTKKSFFERMREEGIEVAPFLPVRFPQFTSKANYRNHRKLIVIDGLTGYIGGMNIALRYLGKGEKGEKAIWRDTMARIEGKGVYSLQRAFLIDWYFVDRTLLSDKKYYTSEELRVKSEEFATALEESCEAVANSSLFTLNSSLLQTITSGPSSPEPEIMQGYVHIILNARRYVYIETPYFLPTATLLFALKTAVTTGIDVRLLVPLHGDTWLTTWASRSYLREVAEAGIRVSLYKPGFLHSKLMVCDDSIATCGSTNMDFRSLENNFEANTFFYGSEVATRMRDIYLADEQQSVLLTSLPDRLHPHFRVRLWESLTRLLSPLL